ncbi:NAD(P)H-dependent oxidoreductase [Desulfospira joergensenii]|uniref:NAD(P)H-dependent oxidoreductase n=1 Tax=Desulfospira joergensenii TaxID=53329 RepID=UPI0003B5D281|nr:NAD(P)H-dependent oxidoreductase [Desulfospira joergensenii]
MFVLGLQGSPRKKGNTHDLLSIFMEEAEKQGALTQTLLARELDIQPCKELIVCEKKGFCPIRDEMEPKVYPLLKRADIIVLASPVFFYNVPAQLKALIDRCQMFWGRKYRLELKEPNAKNRQGILLSCGGSGGKKLFDGLELTAKIFFDALSVKYKGGLTYRHIESPGQMAAYPNLREDVKEKVKELFHPFLSGKKILFISREDACLGQMAAAFFRFHSPGGHRVFSAGLEPALELLPQTLKAMEEKSLDLKYLKPFSLDALLSNQEFDLIVYLNKAREHPKIKGRQSIVWEINRPRVMSDNDLKKIRDDLEARVRALIESLPSST